MNRLSAVSGEEYEFLFSIRKSDERKLRLIAQKNRVNLVRVANLVRGKARFHCISWHK